MYIFYIVSNYFIVYAVVCCSVVLVCSFLLRIVYFYECVFCCCFVAQVFVFENSTYCGLLILLVLQSLSPSLLSCTLSLSPLHCYAPYLQPNRMLCIVIDDLRTAIYVKLSVMCCFGLLYYPSYYDLYIARYDG